MCPNSNSNMCTFYSHLVKQRERERESRLVDICVFCLRPTQIRMHTHTIIIIGKIKWNWEGKKYYFCYGSKFPWVPRRTRFHIFPCSHTLIYVSLICISCDRSIDKFDICYLFVGSLTMHPSQDKLVCLISMKYENCSRNHKHVSSMFITNTYTSIEIGWIETKQIKKNSK